MTKIVIDQSMTIFSNTMSMHAPLQKLSLIDQWHFSQTPCPCMHLYKNCHWSINDNFLKHMSLYAPLKKLSLIDQWQFSKSVIDWSMTVFSNTFRHTGSFANCHWSMTIFKIVIDQWQFLQRCMHGHGVWEKCHWSINDNFCKGAYMDMVFKKIVIDRSMTIFEIVIDRSMTILKIVIDRSMTVFVKLHRGTWCLRKLSLIDQWQFL